MKPKRWRCPVCGHRWQLTDRRRPVRARPWMRLYGECLRPSCPVTTITVTVTP